MKELLLRIIVSVTGPFDGMRQLFLQSLILVERKRPLEASLRRLLATRDYLENIIDQRCVQLGNGVHIKHEIMDGIHAFFCERIPEGANVLDIGCGIGALAYDMAQWTNGQVTGIDYDVSHIEFARKRYSRSNLSFVIGDATKSLPDQKADVIVLSSVLEHIEDRKGFLRSILDAHDPKKLLIRVPSVQRHHYVPLKQKLGMFPFSDLDHKTEYTHESLLEEITAAGLTVDHSECRWGDLWVECRKVER